MPTPYSHGYMYGGSAFAMVDDPYPADMKAAAKAGTLKPIDYTNQNSSYAHAAGGVISTAEDVETWIRALVSGKVFNADFQKQWLESVQAEDPENPDGQKYGYGSRTSVSVRPPRCTTTAVRCPASTRSWAMTRITMCRWSFGRT